MDATRKDRALGAIFGTLIGDALGMGCHWYYDLGALRRDHGWVRDYVRPKPGTWHAGLDAGQSSQTGQVARLLLASLAARGGYDRGDVTARLDALLATLDGTIHGGRVTDLAMRDVWAARREGRPWGACGSLAETSEAATRGAILAAIMHDDPPLLARTAWDDIQLTHRDPFIAAQALAFVLTVASSIQGGTLRDASQRAKAWADGLGVIPQATDCFLQPAFVERAARHPALAEVDPLAIAELYGLPCQQGMLLPAAYFYAARFGDDFETAVLTAVNSGGNNMARAGLTGALVGARVGLASIPARFVSGLEDAATVRADAERALTRP